jgi:hypothetical protein
VAVNGASESKVAENKSCETRGPSEYEQNIYIWYESRAREGAVPNTAKVKELNVAHTLDSKSDGKQN